jgi:hypothetical protein
MLWMTDVALFPTQKCLFEMPRQRLRNENRQSSRRMKIFCLQHETVREFQQENVVRLLIEIERIVLVKRIGLIEFTVLFLGPHEEER